MIVSVDSNNHVDRHLEEFMRMCAWIEICGSIGHYADFRVNCDGDGPLHLKFDFYGENLNEIVSSIENLRYLCLIKRRSKFED